MGIFRILAAFWAAAPGVTFSHDVAPILYRQCVSCHRPGGVAPFSLILYQDAAKRAGLISAVTAKRFMPPWLPTEPRFQHERRLSDAEISVLARWAADGTPQGNAAEAPRPPQFVDGWQLGKPDLETEMRAPFDVPAQGQDLYQCFVIPDVIANAHYVRAVDIRPGHTRAVHHALLFQDLSGTARRRDTGTGYSCFGTPGFLPARGLAGWTPGSVPFQTPPGIPEILHAHADLVLQVHYHPTGKPEQDRTRVAIYFTTQKPERRAMDVPLDSNRIDIPAGDPAYKVTDHFTLPVAVDVIAVNPHAHYVCREMYGYAVLPDGSRRTLIHIPNWDFNWQQQYVFRTPVRLPADTRLEMEFIYDNSAANPHNPNNPPKRVVYGPGSLDEMAGLHVTVSPADESDADELDQALWGKMIRAIRGR
ncbi:MAG TPA: hypothetical protein VGS58_01510 [Candidatus Sulfopaludibacter sp.]|nr:hypothetical protein [Candidatus Sulfopaludibacter sp.]